MSKWIFNAIIVSVSLLAWTPSWSSGQNTPAAKSPGGFQKVEKSTAPTGPAPKRDLSGVWMLNEPPALRGLTNYTFTKDGPEMTQWAMDKLKDAKPSNGGKYTLDTTNDPVLTRCDPPGVPRVYFHPYPFEFVTSPKSVLMIYEYDHWLRRLWTDGRPIPEDPDLTWMGTSVAHWEDDTTLVVDTVGLKDKTWLDRLGHPHSDKLHVIERFHRADMGHLEVTITMTDPIALVKPWSATFYYELKPTWEIQEISCSGDYLQYSKFEDQDK